VATHPSFLARTNDADSPATKLAECDESLSLIAADVEQLTTDLERIRAGASPLARWLAERDEELERRKAELADERAIVAELEVRAAVDDPEPVAGHVLYAPFAEKYRLVASDEPCPKPGEVCDLDGRSFVVTRVGRSPFPADRRPCAFLRVRTVAA